MATVNESCFFNEQCEAFYFQTHCLDGHCICRFDLIPTRSDDGTFECKRKWWCQYWFHYYNLFFNSFSEKGERPKGPETYIDPAMIGVLVGMALMFVIICVVLRLFSQWVIIFVIYFGLYLFYQSRAYARGLVIIIYRYFSCLYLNIYYA